VDQKINFKPTKVQKSFEALQTGTYAGSGGELRPWSYYDQITLATGQLNIDMFNDSSKNLSESNTEGRSIPQGSHYAFDAVKCFYVPVGAKTQAEFTAIMDWLSSARLIMEIDNKPNSFEYKLLEIFGESLPMVVSGAVAGDQLSTRSLVQGSRPLFGLVVLASLTGYKVRIESTVAVPAGANDDKLLVHFVGAKKSLN